MAVSARSAPSHLLPTPLLSLPPSKPTTRLNLPPHHPIPNSRKDPLKTSALSSNLSPTTPSYDPSPHICRLCLHGHLEQALLLLRDSTPHHELDEEAYVSLLQLCERKRAAEEGYRVYAQLYSRRSRLSLRLGNFLLSMLAKLEDMYNARKVFDEMPQRDTFSWSAMLSGYVKLGFLDEVLELYDGMLRAGERPSVYVFPCVLKACGDVGDAGRGRAVHAHVLRFGFGSDVDVLTALVSTYSKCGDVGSARKVFDAMPSRPRTSWGVMALGYLKHGKCVEVLELFRTMRGLSVIPDLLTMTGVIKACWVVGDESLGKALHAYLIRTWLGGEVAVHNSLLKMYFSFGDVEGAEKVFFRMPLKDLVSWNTMVSGYKKNGFPGDAIRVFQAMESQGLVPDKAVITSVLSACASTRNLELGTDLHELAVGHGLLQSAGVRAALIDMYSKCNRVDKALEVFKGMPEKGVIAWTSMITGLRVNGRSFEALNLFRQMLADLEPNCVALVAALSACSDAGALMCGKEIHAHALRSGLAFHDVLPNALLDLYAKCGTMELTHRQFVLHENKDVISLTIMLDGYANHGLSASSSMEALMYGKEMHAHMLRCGLAFHGFLPTALLDLYAKCGGMELAYRQFELLEDKDVVSWTIMLSGYNWHGLREQARAFSERMEEAGINPDEPKVRKDSIEDKATGEGAMTVEERLGQWGSSYKGHSGLKEDINFRLSENIQLEGFNAGIFKQTPPTNVGKANAPLETSTSLRSKRERRFSNETEIERVMDSMDEFMNAIMLGNAMIEKSRRQNIDYSGAEVCAGLQAIGIEPHLVSRAYVYLARNPEMMKAYLDCPPSLRKQVVLEMIRDV